MNHYVKEKNKLLRNKLNLKESKQDNKLYSLQKISYVEDDVFKYYFPFCLINLPISTVLLLRKHFPAWQVGFATLFMIEYVFFVFSFPIEAHLFHKAALDANRPYSQYLRDSYISRFPHTYKAACY